jgi:hypothetical protein
MLFGQDRVEEDLERIRRANAKPGDELSGKEPIEIKEKFEAKDILAMIIAIFSIIGPYLLIFILVIAALVFFMTR